MKRSISPNEVLREMRKFANTNEPTIFVGTDMDAEDDLVQQEPRTLDVHKRCGFNGCNKFCGHGGFHEVDAQYDLPTSQKERDDVDVQDARDAEYVTNNMNAARQRRAVRQHRQGIRFFRLYRATGPRVEVLAVEAKKGLAVVEGKRGVYTVALHDLFCAAV